MPTRMTHAIYLKNKNKKNNKKIIIKSLIHYTQQNKEGWGFGRRGGGGEVLKLERAKIDREEGWKEIEAKEGKDR